MKKTLSIALALILISSGLTPVHADKSAKELYEESGNILIDIGVLVELRLDDNLKRQHMPILISRLYQEEDKASKFVGKNTFKDLTPERKQDIPYITWAVSKGLFSGMGDGTFGFGRDVTVQEYQSVLIRTLGYVANWDNVPKVAKELGIMDGISLDSKSKLTRGQMATMTINTLRQQKKGSSITLAKSIGLTIPDSFKVESTTKVENNTILFEGKATNTNALKLHLKPVSSDITTGEKFIDVVTDIDGNFSYKAKDLQVGTYQYRFQSDKNFTEFKTVSISLLPFDLVEVKADNLKEITLKYTQPLDKTTTSLASNFTTTAGSIKDIRFEENDTKIILTLNGTMAQQGKYKISALKMKSASGIEKELKGYEFNAFDDKMPRVLQVKQLGTKGIRLYLSEPIKSAAVNNFKVDGKSFPGNVKLEYNIITLTYFSSIYSLSEGNHTLSVSGLEDFAGYKAIDENIPFTILKDTTAPKIKNASATLEEVIIEFDEDIDPVSAKNNNFYWKSGSIKRYANNVTFVGNKAIVDFTSNRLSTNKNTIYVENVVDYSNNKMNSDEISVVPVIDMTSPEVLSYKVSDDGRSITVYYSKNVLGNTRNNYSITDKDNKTINIRDVQGSGREYTINLYSTLPVGINTLTIQGVQDTTPLKNPVIGFSTTIDMKDIEKPKIVSHTGYGNHIIIQFSKQMDMNTVSNPSNYVMSFGGRLHHLPIDTLFTPSDNGKSVTLLLPEEFDGKKVMLGTSGNLTALDIRGLKDVVGNDTDPLLINITFDSTASGKAKAVDYYNHKPGKQGVLVESNLIKVKFNIPIVQANTSDFAISGRTITNIVVDGTNEVQLYLNDSDMTYVPAGSLSILANNSMKSYIDTGVESGTIQLVDEVAPRIKDSTNYLSRFGNQIEIPFSELLEDEGSGLYRRDLEIVRLVDGVTLNTSDYTTSLKHSDKSILVVTINKSNLNSGYSIRLADESNSGGLTYIRDKDGNLALPSYEYISN